MAARILGVLVVSLMLVSVFPASVLSHPCPPDCPPPPPPGDEGCTPGYWKQEHHFDSWVPTGYSPTQQVSSVFSSFTGVLTLDQALDGGGGPGVAGAIQILLRAAVAALLNAAHPDVDYPLSVSTIITQTNAAITSQNRTTILNRAADFDNNNNLGCTLN